jgi:hypothetical protein
VLGTKTARTAFFVCITTTHLGVIRAITTWALKSPSAGGTGMLGAQTARTAFLIVKAATQLGVIRAVATQSL